MKVLSESFKPEVKVGSAAVGPETPPFPPSPEPRKPQVKLDGEIFLKCFKSFSHVLKSVKEILPQGLICLNILDSTKTLLTPDADSIILDFEIFCEFFILR